MEPRSHSIPAKNELKKENNDVNSLSNQISFQGSELIPEQIIHAKKDDENKLFKVTGVIQLNGQPKEVHGTLKLLTEDNESIKNYNIRRNIIIHEQKRPDVVPIHRRMSNHQNKTSTGSGSANCHNFSQDNLSIISGKSNMENRRTSNSYSIPSDDDIVQRVRVALKRIPIDAEEVGSLKNENCRRLSLDRQRNLESMSMNTFNTLPHPRRKSQNSDVSNIFNSMVARQFPDKKGSDTNIQKTPYDFSHEDYNEPYDHMQSGSSRNSRSSSLYNSSTRSGEEMYGNNMALRNNEHISAPSKFDKQLYRNNSILCY